MAIARGVGPLYMTQGNVTSGTPGTLVGTTAGRSLIFVVFWYDPASTTTISSITIDAQTATLSAGSKFTNLAALSNTSGQIAYLPSITGSGDKTITLTFSDAAYAELAVMEYAGLDTASLVDASSNEINTTADPSTTLVTTSANTLIVAGVMNDFGDVTAGSGYTLFGGAGMGNSLYYAEAEDNLDAGAAGSKTVSFSGFTNTWGVTMASFHIAGGGGGRAAKNTRGWGLGTELGMGIWMPNEL